MKLARIFGWALIAGFLAIIVKNGAWVVRHREELGPVAQGDAAPPISLALLDGGRYELRPGAVTVIDFWASWCPPCRAELPVLDKLAGRYKNEGANIVAVNVEELDARPDVERFVRDAHLTLPIALDGAATSNRFRVDSLPTVIVIDATARIRKVFVGPADEEELVAAIEAAKHPIGDRKSIHETP